MVETRSCDYCGSDIEPGTGTMYVHVDGRVVHFCSSKCENNAELGRASRDLEWTAEGQRIGANQAGTPEAAEQVAAEPTTEGDETVADEIDTVEGESDAEAVAAAAVDTESDDVPTDDPDEVVDAGAETDELDEVEGRRAGGSDPDIEEDQDVPEESDAEVNVGEETEREVDDDAEFTEEDVERTSDETVSQDEADETVVDEDREEADDEDDQ
ncbi:50S ribosomal protein L24e [Halococcus hamelinensis]|uniref:Large ribosomal subunit protein eL24 n=1 Tax=Halococcus hamelinensis 100A6 TaxID=1132509 RepID=M0LWI6_9EURY|nr:50S ribosomal protein L24e [Halococcus hamelinensis]EMA36460.1 50S ribosomal protein L24e/unknown domain fusion protein [Halococcus hamelinensis 100A6]